MVRLRTALMAVALTLPFLCSCGSSDSFQSVAGSSGTALRREIQTEVVYQETQSGPTFTETSVNREGDVLVGVSGPDSRRVVLLPDGEAPVTLASLESAATPEAAGFEPRLDATGLQASWLASSTELVLTRRDGLSRQFVLPEGYGWQRNLGIGHSPSTQLFLLVSTPQDSQRLARLDAESGEVQFLSFQGLDSEVQSVEVETGGEAAVVLNGSGQLLFLKGLAQTIPSFQLLTDQPVRLFEISSDFWVHYLTRENQLVTWAPPEYLLSGGPQKPVLAQTASQAGQIQVKVNGDAPAIAQQNLIQFLKSIGLEGLKEIVDNQEQDEVDYMTAIEQGISALFTQQDLADSGVDPGPLLTQIYDALLGIPTNTFIAIPQNTRGVAVESGGDFLVVGLSLDNGVQVLRGTVTSR